MLTETLAEKEDMEKRQAEEEDARNKAAREAVTNPPPCAACGKAFFETCTNFMTTHYCTRACQFKHWLVHKLACTESQI